MHPPRIILQYIQPGLLGLMDGTISTLAPLFAAAFATNDPHVTLLIGLSAAIGAAISMGFAEALSDTGELTGRGKPFQRGLICGGMTFVGGMIHSLPFLIPDITVALHIAYVVVGLELLAISYVRYHYFNLSLWLSIVQVIIGSSLVIAAGIFIGSA